MGKKVGDIAEAQVSDTISNLANPVAEPSPATRSTSI